MKANTKKGHKGVSYAKWGYIFILPFFIIYFLCSFIPQVLTIYNSFFENYMNGLQQIGPNFVGFKNYITLFTPDKNGDIGMVKYFLNTMIMWLGGAIPQVLVALLLAVFFTSYRLRVKGQGFFKAVIYMPNLIMASAFAMLFFTLFSPVGPFNQFLVSLGKEVFLFDAHAWSQRMLVALMNFLMWFGNTTLVLMAGIMGIDQSLFESAAIDGASATKVFFKITLPLLSPILVYTIVTALIGGLQMFDVPQVLTKSMGGPNRTTMTMVMNLNSYLSTSKNYGMAGAISVILFIVSAALSMLVFKTLVKGGED